MNPNVKAAQLVSCVLAISSLAACSGEGPSTSDIKARFETNLSGCDYVHLSNFTREGDQLKEGNQEGIKWATDQIKVSYTISLDKIPEVKTAVANFLDLTNKEKALRADADAKQKILGDGELAAGYHPDGTSAANDYLAAHPDQVAAAQAADQAALEAEPDPSKLGGSATWQIAAATLEQVCPNLKSAGNVANMFWSPRSDPTTYGTAVSRKFNENLVARQIDGGDWSF